MRVETVAEQLFFTTVFVSAENTAEQWTATGFVHAVEVEEGTLHVLITNRHVLESADRLTVRMIRADDNGQPALGQATQITVEGFSAGAWHGHPDDRVDVAAFPLGAVLQGMVDIGSPAFFRSLAPDHFATPELLDDLDALEPVTFVGYPNGLYDAVNFLPIAHRGTTATPIAVDYEGLPAFLIDASVFPGSSGSPVCLADRGIYGSRDGAAVAGDRFALLGVLSAVEVRQTATEVVALPTKFGVVVEEVLDLGMVFKARTIEEVVDGQIAGLGLRRTAAAPSAPPGQVTDVDEHVAEALPLREP